MARGDGAGAYAAASELPRIELADALALTLLLVDQRELFECLSVRWLGRFASEVRDARQRHLNLALAAFAMVRPGDPTGAQALGALCSGLGRFDLTAVLDNWLDRGGW